jgi:ATP-dependent DNA helicase PIF1
LSSTEGEIPFILTQKQFPIQLYFAMTINKSQGQSFSQVGVDLRRSLLTHGQLYVALSRVTNVDQLSVVFDKDKPKTVKNVVYPEVLIT